MHASLAMLCRQEGLDILKVVTQKRSFECGGESYVCNAYVQHGDVGYVHHRSAHNFLDIDFVTCGSFRQRWGYQVSDFEPATVEPFTDS